jgi:hypothetical protein
METQWIAPLLYQLSHGRNKKNENQVALEAGNSPQMIFSNYRQLVTESDARTWFSIVPGAGPKANPYLAAEKPT